MDLLVKTYLESKSFLALNNQEHCNISKAKTTIDCIEEEYQLKGQENSFSEILNE